MSPHGYIPTGTRLRVAEVWPMLHFDINQPVSTLHEWDGGLTVGDDDTLAAIARQPWWRTQPHIHINNLAMVAVAAVVALLGLIEAAEDVTAAVHLLWTWTDL